LKILLKKRFFLISLVITILALAIAGTVLAANVIVVPGKVNVVAATYDIQVYSDSACTIPLTNLVWAADLPEGGQRERTVYIKNIGNMDALVTVTLQSPPNGVTIVNNTLPISSGATAAFNVVLQADPFASIGSAQAFSITFNSAAPPPAD